MRFAQVLKRVHNSAQGRIRQLTFRESTILRTFGEDSFKFVLGDLFGKNCYGQSHDRWPELDWIRDFAIESGTTVIDCGANHGFTTVLFAKWTGSRGRVLAFEPLPHNLDILRRNIALNHLDNVTLFPIALGSKDGLADLNNQSNASILHERRSARTAITVPVKSLDSQVEPSEAMFVKVDVEGFELELLKGAERVLQSRPKLALEIHVGLFRDKCAAIREILDRVGLGRYRVYLQTEVDGRIEPYCARLHCVPELAKCRGVHLFCL